MIFHRSWLDSVRRNLCAKDDWRRGWDSNPRMMVLQTIPLGHLGTAPLPEGVKNPRKTSIYYARNLCPKLCPKHPIFAYSPLFVFRQPIDAACALLKKWDLQTSPLGPL